MDDLDVFQIKETSQRKIFTGFPDIDTEILLNLEDYILSNTFQVNRYAADLCNESFWNKRIQKMYGVSNLKKYKGNFTYKFIYINLRNKYAGSALYFAINEGYTNVAIYIFNLPDTTYDPYSLLVSTIRRGNLELLKYFVETSEFIKKYFILNHSLIFPYTAVSGNIEIIKYFETYVANICENNSMILILASKKGHLDMTRYLIENGVNVHTNNDNALVSASEKGHIKVMEYLLEQGATIESNGQSLK